MRSKSRNVLVVSGPKNISLPLSLYLSLSLSHTHPHPLTHSLSPFSLTPDSLKSSLNILSHTVRKIRFGLVEWIS